MIVTKLNNMNNEQQLILAFSESLSLETTLVNDSLVYQGIPEWDSISHMFLISKIEEIFDVSLDTEDVIDMSSFAKAKEILSKYNIAF